MTSAQSSRSSRSVFSRTIDRESLNVGDVRVVEADVGAALGDAGDDVGRRRVAGVVDVRLEGDAEDADLRALERLAAIVERLGDEVDDVARHREVDVAGQLR